MNHQMQLFAQNHDSGTNVSKLINILIIPQEVSLLAIHEYIINMMNNRYYTLNPE